MIYPDLYALLHSDPEAARRLKAFPAHTRNSLESGVPTAGLENFRQGISKHPFPLGVYPVFDDDVPRDSSFDNFPVPDLRDPRSYPLGLRQQDKR